MIELRDLHIGYQKKTIAGPINEQLIKGDLVCLLGPNGTGKSTLVKTIAGLIEPLNGLLRYNGKKITELSSANKSKILSVVLTEPIIIGNLTAIEIVELGRFPYKGWWGKNSDMDYEIIEKAISSTGISHLRNRKIAELSDGEKQKIMIARALAQDTDFIILDEPTSHLDLPSKIEVMSLLKQLVHKWNKSILVSTHDLNLAIQTADKFWLIDMEGNFSSGVNEDLILNGQLNNCFGLKDTTYSFSTGKVYFPSQNKKEINLIGTGNKINWTRHALERLDFTISKDTELKVELNNSDQWVVQSPDGRYTASSISEMINHLKSFK